jgi:hypothetical protein
MVLAQFQRLEELGQEDLTTSPILSLPADPLARPEGAS